MKTKIAYLSLSLFIALSMILGACAPATPAAPASQPTQAPAVVEAPTSAPAAAPTTAPAAPSQPASKPSRIVFADNDSYYTLDPLVSASQYLQHAAVFDRLWETTPDFTRYSGVMAEKWGASEDGLSINITLKPGLKFTDGTPVDAEAIKWNVDQYSDPNVNSPFGGWMVDVVERTETTGDLDLTIFLKEPYAPFYYWMSQVVFVSPTAYEKLGADEFAVKPVGSGPFVVKEIVPDVSILYEANPEYKNYPDYLDNRGPSMVDELLIKFGLDDNVIYAQLETGEVDLAQIPAPIVPTAKNDPRLELVQVVQAGVRYLGFNTEVAPFNDLAFRQAVAFGLDRDELITVGYEGEAIPVWNPLSPSVFGYSDAVEQEAKASEPFDPDLAIQKLDEAGYVDVNNDGLREDKEGKPMKLTLAYSEGVTTKLVCETLQGQLKDIGLDVSLSPVEGAVIMDQTKQGTHQMIYWSYGLSDATILTYMFKSSRIGGSNRTRFNSPEMDRLLNIMESEMDPAVRLGKVDDAVRYVISQRPMIPLLSELRYYGFRKDKFENVQFDKSGFPVLGDASPVR